MKESRKTRVGSPILEYITQLYRKYANIKEGEVASYIPELSLADSKWFGICIATTDGQIYEVGKTRQQFTIQSTSKAFSYGLALEDNGKDYVLSKVGVEPSGDAFNSISLNPKTGCPVNPMINAGAIAITGLIKGKDKNEKRKRLLNTFAKYVGHEVRVDHRVYKSESNTGHRNRAIGHMLRNFDIINGDPEPVLDLYFQQCSISIDCRDLGVMAATLANGGINPVTKVCAVKHEYVENILSVMGTCGMYDYAGEWIYRIGMPSKSGVAGGILIVLPGQLGIAVFSPPLDERGNSVRGIKVLNEISRDFNLHLFNVPRVSKSAIRAKYDASQVTSNRLRTDKEAKVLNDFGSLIKLYELQGGLMFASTEVVIKDIINSIESTKYIIIDLKRVIEMDGGACKLFFDLLKNITTAKKHLVFSNTKNVPLLEKYFKDSVRSRNNSMFMVYDDNDLALEWCENKLISTKLTKSVADKLAPISSYELCKGFSKKELSYFESILKLKTFKKGNTIIRKGSKADNMFFLAKGNVSVVLRLPNGNSKRLATFPPGMAFGEMAILDRSVRSADVIADTDVSCYALSVKDFEQLDQYNANLKKTLLINLACNLSQKLRKANIEISALCYG